MGHVAGDPRGGPGERSAQRRPAFLAGHSLGEYQPLLRRLAHARKTPYALVRERGRLMRRQGRSDRQRWAIVGLKEHVVADICRQSGQNRELQTPRPERGREVPQCGKQACALAKTAGGPRMPVNVSGAFHTSLMAPAAREFARCDRRDAC